MPDRKFTYQVEIDANQARAAARQVRSTFEQELRSVSGGGGGGGGIGLGVLGGVAGALGGALGVASVRRVWEFAAASSEMARKQADAARALAQVAGGSAQAASAIDQLQEATGHSVDRTEAATLLMKEYKKDLSLTTTEAVKLAAATEINATSFDRLGASLRDVRAGAFDARGGLGSLFGAFAELGTMIAEGPLSSFAVNEDYWARIGARTSVGRPGFLPPPPPMPRHPSDISSGLGIYDAPATTNQWLVSRQADAVREQQRLDEQTAKKAQSEWERAADEAASAWEQAANEFESRLRAVPGLMGTSAVTQGQMDLASLGVGQNFADDYLRRLSDEVLNKTEWADVDLGEAARLGGIDQGLPPEAQLALFRQKWESSSLFANPDALKLINQDAVRAALAEQKAGEAGQANILKLFGLDEEMKPADQEKLLGTGVNLVDQIHSGFSDQANSKDWVGAITNALLAQAQGISAPSSTAPAPLGDMSGALGITP